MDKNNALFYDKHSYLAEHAERFTKRIEKVTEGVYSAIGYGLANSILLITDVGNIIVDTTESIRAAQEIKGEFDEISPLSTVAVIYTHGHTDHVCGASVFMDEGTEVYANAKTKDLFNQQFNQLDPILTVRGARQFGVKIPREYLPAMGLGPFLHVDGYNPQLVMPTQEFEDLLELRIGGLRLKLVSAPGETDDQIFIWIPEKKVLLSADNYYPCFPNLYTIRGTTPRPVYKWVESLDKMRDLGAEYLVPSHAEPIYGSERIHELLTVYRDAIQYVHDSVVRGMNQGKTPDELVEGIYLPPHLQTYKELRELYGELSQSIRAIYDGYLGWFDGNATNLIPLSKAIRAQKIVDLAGGYQKMLKEIRTALDNKEYQWTAEISDMLLTITPDNDEVTSLKAEALFKLGCASQNSNNRAYYLTQSLELKGEIHYRPRSVDKQLSYAKSMSVDQFFSNMAIRLNPDKSKNDVITASVQITDNDAAYQIQVRRGVAEVRRGYIQYPDLWIETTGVVWKEVIIGAYDIREALHSGKVQLVGEVDLLRYFVNLFKSDSE
ncbi:alkyl sulfatase dimerization domain-containing protein [Virgibacillus salexigens]|uniref:alkyl sulfatase dimerization domain-containing protein n=1 Tax=Virgibacillus salexigens TaxID=61016 RepID=UPI00190D1286|nr:alkyl sulfatase dimerization domain-containing protein [Virgibacillus salexigens]